MSCTALMDHPRRAVDGVSFLIKFWTNRKYGFGDIAIDKQYVIFGCIRVINTVIVST